MTDDALPLVLVTRALPEGWLSRLDGRCSRATPTRLASTRRFAPRCPAPTRSCAC